MEITFNQVRVVRFLSRDIVGKGPHRKVMKGGVRARGLSGKFSIQ